MTVPDPVAYCPDCESKGVNSRLIAYASTAQNESHICLICFVKISPFVFAKLAKEQGGYYRDGDTDPSRIPMSAECSCGKYFKTLQGLSLHKAACGGTIRLYKSL